MKYSSFPKIDEDRIKDFLYEKNESDTIRDFLDKELQDKGISGAYRTYISTHFAQFVQIYLGEGLKDPRNSDALIDFQRMLLKELKKINPSYENTLIKIQNNYNKTINVKN
ncbi:hypothetical protein GGR21_001246 [Dysgonomonas hofstadii]|uniref:Uncharacterized protein n=1 Tax=Dysgonomonas hofstadii TaxID=637886 RepID=A0A840CH77_9BACT|nr:hypothetical protein [Dysgonomonas hofstadii]MBB4035357.1 hypothetical protein [Dysgonomonas hofstadii]